MQRSREVPTKTGWKCRWTGREPESKSLSASARRAISTICTRWSSFWPGVTGASGGGSVGCDRQHGQLGGQLQVEPAAARQAPSDLPWEGVIDVWLQQERRSEPLAKLHLPVAQHARRDLWEQQPPRSVGRVTIPGW